jgi:hypothetical protein
MALSFWLDFKTPQLMSGYVPFPKLESPSPNSIPPISGSLVKNCTLSNFHQAIREVEIDFWFPFP